MATATTPLAVSATQVTQESWLQKFEHGFESVMDKIGEGVEVALEYIIQYTPSAAKIADLILPQYEVLIDGASTIVESVAELIRNTVLAAQQAYAKVADSGATKLANVLATLTTPITSLLSTIKVNVDVSWLTNAIEVVVRALKLVPWPLPAAAATAS